MRLLLILLIFSLETLSQGKIDNRLNKVKEYKAVFNNETYGGVKAKTTISFELNRKKNCIHIEENTSESYIALRDQIRIPFSVFYDNNSSVGNLYCQKNNSSRKNKVIFLDSKYEINGIFHSDYRIKYHSLFLEKKGELKTLSYRKEYNDPKYFTKIQLMSPTSFLEKEVIVKIPDWANINIVEFNFENFDIEKQIFLDKKENLKIITYKARAIKGLPHYKNSEGSSFFAPHLVILVKSHSYKKHARTYLNQTSDLYNWYRLLTKDLPSLNDNIKDFTLSLLNDSSSLSDLEKINRVYFWVQSNIRYIAFEDGIAGFKPDDANNVFEKKYGDCKGKANLLKEMLNTLGYDARLTWVGTNSLPYDYTLPSLCVDNHMICSVFLNGNIYYLDGTEIYQSANFDSYRVRGKQVMIENKDTFLLKKIPNNTALVDKIIEKKQFSFEEGVLSCEASVLYAGDSRKRVVHGLHNSSNPKNFLSFFLENGNKSIRDLKIIKKELNDPSVPVNIDYSYQLVNAVVKIENDIFVDIQNNLFQMDYEFDSTQISAIDFGRFVYNQKEYSINIKNYNVIHIPKELVVNNKDFKLNYKWDIQNHWLTLKFKIQVPSGKVSVSELRNWSIALEELKLRIEDKLIVKKK